MNSENDIHLVQILLPLWDNEGKPLASNLYAWVRAELLAAFGGLTAYARAPAEGEWKPKEEPTIKDRIIVFEVMVHDLRLDWWKDFQKRLEASFRQDHVVIRAQQMLLI